MITEPEKASIAICGDSGGDYADFSSLQGVNEGSRRGGFCEMLSRENLLDELVTAQQGGESIT